MNEEMQVDCIFEVVLQEWVIAVDAVKHFVPKKAVEQKHSYVMTYWIAATPRYCCFDCWYCYFDSQVTASDSLKN